MPIELNERETRVIGCLMEKSVVTPDQYPLTLNALTSACNQKSSREPVMNLSSGEVLGTVRTLQEKHLIRVEENFKTQVDKFTHRLCNTPFSDYQFDPAQFAVMTVLLLRGPRTPGELKANAGRLHSFESNEDVQETLQSLVDREGGPVVAQLPRTPGRRDHAYAHLLSGDIDTSSIPSAVEPHATIQRSTIPESAIPPSTAQAGLEARLSALEAEVSQLKAELQSLMD